MTQAGQMKTMGIYLKQSLQAWDSDNFRQTLKRELEGLAPEQLPLQQGLANSSYVTDRPFTVLVLNSQARQTSIQAKVGIMYSGIIAGCNCADDPTPVDEQNEYCELLLVINRASGLTVVHLCSD